jgi:hypothetical protein
MSTWCYRTRPPISTIPSSDMGDKVVHEKLLKNVMQLNLVLLAIEQFNENGFMNVYELIIFYSLNPNSEVISSIFSVFFFNSRRHSFFKTFECY